MMKTKFKFMWHFSILSMIGLLLTFSANAQIAATEQHRDSTSHYTVATRAQFNSWPIESQKDFLLRPGFSISDIVNVEPSNYLDGPQGDQQFIYDEEFYSSVLDKQLDILHKPTTYIVFPSQDSH